VSYPPEVKTEAYELYLAGRAPGEIARELARRHPDRKSPSPKAVEAWAYERDGEGKTWSDRRYEAECAARDKVTTDFVGVRTRMLQGVLRLQEKLQERALNQAEATDPGSFSQEVFAYLNATKAASALLETRLAEETRQKDAIDCLIEAVRRVVPNFESLEGQVRVEFQKLVARREGAASGQ
jgi:hypothetical protein